MNIALRQKSTPVQGVEHVNAPEGLGVFHRSDVAAVVWNRAPKAAFLDWINELPVDQLPTARVILRAEQVRETVLQLCEMAGTPDCAERAMLIDDIAAMAGIFGDLMGSEFLRLRLDAVTTNACRKFHMDAMVARLVCTYRGDGTEYGNAEIGGDPEVIQAVGTGSPIFLRGSLWEHNTSPTLLHRSPPIEGTGQTRLVLVLDPVAEEVERVLH